MPVESARDIRRALEVIAVARPDGIAVCGDCMFETGIAPAAGAQLMAALADLALGCEFYMQPCRSTGCSSCPSPLTAPLTAGLI